MKYVYYEDGYGAVIGSIEETKDFNTLIVYPMAVSIEYKMKGKNKTFTWSRKGDDGFDFKSGLFESELFSDSMVVNTSNITNYKEYDNYNDLLKEYFTELL